MKRKIWGIGILALMILCTGYVRAGEGKESAQNEAVRFSAAVEYLDNALEELGGQDLMNGPVFADGYSCCRLGDTVLYWANHWYGPHQNGSVILAENQTTGEISLADLGCWQRLSVQEIRETSDPTVVRIFFSDGIVFDGSEYYTRSLVDSVDYSLTEGKVTAENSLCFPGRYGMVGDSVEYRHRFGDCEVTEGKVALRFAVTETTGWEEYPQSTEVVLPEVFQPGEPGEILLPRVEPGLPVEFLTACAEAEGIASMAAEPLGSEGGVRLTITPEPGYAVICGFDTPDDLDWAAVLWVWGEEETS